MGQQQLLLLILGVIIVGIAIAVGITMFSGQSYEANKDGVTSSLINIAADAHSFKIRPKVLGGGRPSFIGYVIPNKMQSDDNGTYAIRGSVTENLMVIEGHSALNSAWIASCQVDSNGYTVLSYNGWN